MRSKLKTFLAVVGILVIVTAISLIVISRGPLYGQAENDNWVPNLMGEWISEAAAYAYEDMTDPFETPGYFPDESLSDEGNIIIMEQRGRVFWGKYEYDSVLDHYAGKLTGVILPDRTVSIQFFELSEFRMFFTGRMTESGGTLQISGYVHAFDDLHHRHFPYEEGGREMGSGYVQLSKID